MATSIKSVNMYVMGSYNCNNSKRKNFGNRNDQLGPQVRPENRESIPRKVGCNILRIEDMMREDYEKVRWDQ